MEKIIKIKALVLSVVFFVVSGSAFALEPITYLDENGEEKTITDYTILTGEETSLTRGWYVVQGQIEFKTPNWKRIDVLGNVNLVLMDDCECIVRGSGGFDGLEFGSKMNIYAQSHGEHEGKMCFDIDDLFCFHMWEFYIYGGSFILDGCKDQCAGISAYDIVLKNCTVNINAYVGLTGINLTTDGVDLTVKAERAALSMSEWAIKNTDQTPVINISGWEDNNVGNDVVLPEGMEMTIGEEKYTGTISAEVINGSKGFSVGAGSENPTMIENVQSEWNASQSREGLFTLDGVHLTDKPTEKGIYIHNGRKVFVK